MRISRVRSREKSIRKHTKWKWMPMLCPAGTSFHDHSRRLLRAPWRQLLTVVAMAMVTTMAKVMLMATAWSQALSMPQIRWAPHGNTQHTMGPPSSSL